MSVLIQCHPSPRTYYNGHVIEFDYPILQSRDAHFIKIVVAKTPPTQTSIRVRTFESSLAPDICNYYIMNSYSLSSLPQSAECFPVERLGPPLPVLPLPHCEHLPPANHCCPFPHESGISDMVSSKDELPSLERKSRQVVGRTEFLIYRENSPRRSPFLFEEFNSIASALVSAEAEGPARGEQTPACPMALLLQRQ